MKTIKRVSVKNMTSNSGNDIANQFIICTPEGNYFQSYSAIIVFIPYGSGKVVLDKNAWDYSQTTGKYRNQFLGEKKADTECKIKDGTYKLADLN